jgi:hypothetical protein
VQESSPLCSLSASSFASLAAFRAMAAASWANLAAFFASNRAAAAGDNPGHWRAWKAFFFKASSLVSFSVASDSAACSDAVVMTLARSRATTSPSIFLIRSRPVVKAVYSTLTWKTTSRSQSASRQHCLRQVHDHVILSGVSIIFCLIIQNQTPFQKLFWHS